MESDFNLVIFPPKLDYDANSWKQAPSTGNQESFPEKKNVAFSVQQVIQTNSWFSNILNWVPQVKALSVKPEAVTPIPGTQVWERKKLLKLSSEVNIYTVSAQMHTQQ